MEECDALTNAPEALGWLTGLRELLLGSTEHSATLQSAIDGQQDDVLIEGSDAQTVLPDSMQGLTACLQKPGWNLSAYYNVGRWRLLATQVCGSDWSTSFSDPKYFGALHWYPTLMPMLSGICWPSIK